MLPEIRVEFCITSHELLPTQITQILGLLPSRTWLEGESIQGTKLRRKHNGWCLAVDGAESTIDLEVPIRELLTILLPKIGEIDEARSGLDVECELSCAITIADETPVINLSPATVGDLVRLNAAIDIDIILATFGG